MKRGLVTLAAAMLVLLPAAAGVVLAQGPAKLGIKEILPLPPSVEFTTLVMEPVKCDNDSNLYMRSYRKGKMAAAPVVRISADGRRTTVYAIESATDPALKAARFNDFVITLRGRVYFIANLGNEVYLVAFRDDGQFDLAFKLDAGVAIYPEQLAAFADGDFLFSGVEYQRGRTVSVKPFTAIFDPLGKLVKELQLPGDISMQAPQPKPAGTEEDTIKETKGGPVTQAKEDVSSGFQRSRPERLGREPLRQCHEIFWRNRGLLRRLRV